MALNVATLSYFMRNHHLDLHCMRRAHISIRTFHGKFQTQTWTKSQSLLLEVSCYLYLT